MNAKIALLASLALLAVPTVAAAQAPGGTPAPAPDPFAPPPAQPPPGLEATPPPGGTPGDATAGVAATVTPSDRGAFVIGFKAGGLFPQAFSPLGPSFLVDVEAGYLLPQLNRGLAVLLDAGFTQPTAAGTQNDVRVDANGNSYKWDLTQRQLMFGLTLMYRATFFFEGKVAPYVGVGPRLWLLQTKVVGEAGSGNPINESTEQSTKVGVMVPLGVDVHLGPGRIFAEVQLLWAPIDHRITGDSSVGAFTVDVGYRFLL